MTQLRPIIQIGEKTKATTNYELLEPFYIEMEDPIHSHRMMFATYFLSAVGFWLGVQGLEKDVPDLTLSSYVLVFGTGFLSFLRHTVFYHSDETRIGWKPTDMLLIRTPVEHGENRDTADASSAPKERFVNLFLIELGFAHFSWGLIGLLAAALDWGLKVEAAIHLIFGTFVSMVALMLMILFGTGNKTVRSTKAILGTLTFSVMLLYLGLRGMQKGLDLEKPATAADASLA